MKIVMYKNMEGHMTTIYYSDGQLAAMINETKMRFPMLEDSPDFLCFCISIATYFNLDNPDVYIRMDDAYADAKIKPDALKGMKIWGLDKLVVTMVDHQAKNFVLSRNLL